jgi:hypothetical protein
MIAPTRAGRRTALSDSRAKWIQAIPPVAVFVALVAAGIVEFVLSRHVAHPDRPPGGGPDATTFISTLIAIYAVFLSVYGVFLPLLLGPGNRRDRWQRLVIALVVVAVGADLWRIWNSFGDLYLTTERNLSSGRVDDAGYEFTHVWFVVNLVAILAASSALAFRRVPKAAASPSTSDGQATTKPVSHPSPP